MASGTNGASNSSGQQALDRFAQMMIERMEKMKGSDWEKGWIGVASSAGLPQNIMGRNYSGSNSFFLQLHTAAQGYELPVFLTFKQAHNFKAHVLTQRRESLSGDIDMMVRDKTQENILRRVPRHERRDERKNLDVYHLSSVPGLQHRPDQFPEAQPERVQKLLDRFKVPEMRDTQGMYAHGALDRMVAEQTWLCPIQADRKENGAYYSPSRDIVVLPMKQQFNKGATPEDIYRDGMEFYSTMLHEMTHSTMTPPKGSTVRRARSSATRNMRKRNWWPNLQQP